MFQEWDKASESCNQNSGAILLPNRIMRHHDFQTVLYKRIPTLHDFCKAQHSRDTAGHTGL